MRSMLVAVYFQVAWLLRQPWYLVKHCRVARSSRIESGCNLVDSAVGAYTYLGSGVFMNATIVGNYCSVAPGVKIGGMEHSWWWGSTSPRISLRNVHGQATRIGDDVWIGANAVIRQGVHIGRGAVVGAGAVVLTDVDANTIVAGVPSRPIRKRFSDELASQVHATRFWEFPPQRARALLDALTFPDKPAT